MQTKDQSSLDSAMACLESITAFSLRADVVSDSQAEDDLLQELQEYPLSFLVRSGWQQPGEELEAMEYELLLCTGGPAVRITGDLDASGDPCSATLQHQDWGTPWTDVFLSADDQEHLLWFAQQFSVG